MTSLKLEDTFRFLPNLQKLETEFLFIFIEFIFIPVAKHYIHYGPQFWPTWALYSYEEFAETYIIYIEGFVWYMDMTKEVFCS